VDLTEPTQIGFSDVEVWSVEVDFPQKKSRASPQGDSEAAKHRGQIARLMTRSQNEQARKVIV